MVIYLYTKIKDGFQLVDLHKAHIRSIAFANSCCGEVREV